MRRVLRVVLGSMAWVLSALLVLRGAKVFRVHKANRDRQVRRAPRDRRERQVEMGLSELQDPLGHLGIQGLAGPRVSRDRLGQ